MFVYRSLTRLNGKKGPVGGVTYFLVWQSLAFLLPFYMIWKGVKIFPYFVVYCLRHPFLLLDAFDLTLQKEFLFVAHEYGYSVMNISLYGYYPTLCQVFCSVFSIGRLNAKEK